MSAAKSYEHENISVDENGLLMSAQKQRQQLTKRDVCPFSDAFIVVIYMLLFCLFSRVDIVLYAHRSCFAFLC